MYIKLNRILFWCWKSEDFEIKLRENWREFYDDLSNGRENFSAIVVDIIYEWCCNNLLF